MSFTVVQCNPIACSLLLSSTRIMEKQLGMLRSLIEPDLFRPKRKQLLVFTYVLVDEIIATFISIWFYLTLKEIIILGFNIPIYIVIREEIPQSTSSTWLKNKGTIFLTKMMMLLVYSFAVILIYQMQSCYPIIEALSYT